MTIDHDDGQPDHDVAAANLGCAIALVLATVGQTNLAARVAFACAAKSTLITGMHAAFTLAGAFFRSQRIGEALTVVAELARRGDPDSRIAAFVLQSAVFARGRHLRSVAGRLPGSRGQLARRAARQQQLEHTDAPERVVVRGGS